MFPLFTMSPPVLPKLIGWQLIPVELGRYLDGNAVGTVPSVESFANLEKWVCEQFERKDESIDVCLIFNKEGQESVVQSLEEFHHGVIAWMKDKPDCHLVLWLSSNHTEDDHLHGVRGLDFVRYSPITLPNSWTNCAWIKKGTDVIFRSPDGRDKQVYMQKGVE